MSNTDNHAEKSQMAQEVGRLLPETIEKVEHYKDTLRAESILLERLNKRQNNVVLKLIRPVLLMREKIELIKITNGILHKQKIFESYVGRKKKYEKWLDEMAIEVGQNFEKVLEEAESITDNPRLVGSLSNFKETEKERAMTVQERVEFYLYMQQEILNKKNSKRKRR